METETDKLKKESEKSTSEEAQQEEEQKITQLEQTADYWDIKFAKYSVQRHLWPFRGKHILAHYNDKGVVVYQAFRKEIVEYAVANQKFGGDFYNPKRMTWVKTNFLWMMFRSGWGKKPYQDHIVGVWIKRESFERYLSIAATKGSKIRLQWDPDHYPDKSRHPYRRAVQLGLKGITTWTNGEDILCIKDLTAFVASQYPKRETEELETPEERVYPIHDPKLIQHLGLDTWEPKDQKSNVK